MNTSMPSMDTTPSQNIMTKPMMIGQPPLKHGASLKTIFIGIFVVIIIIATAVISYMMGFNAANENAVGDTGNTPLLKSSGGPELMNTNNQGPSSYPSSYAGFDLQHPGTPVQVVTNTDGNPSNELLP